MTRFALLAAALTLSALCSAQVKLPTNHRVNPPKQSQPVAKASGATLTAADIEPFLWEWYGKDAIYEAVSYVIVTQDAAKRGITVSDADVEKGIDAEMKKLLGAQSGNPEQAKAALEKQGFTRSRLFLRTKQTLLIDKIVLAGFRPENFVKVSTILVRTNSADATAVSAAITKSQGAYDQLKKGDDWGKVLASVTQDSKVIQSKGVLGWRMMEVFPESVKKEIVSLRPGQFTHPAQTQYGIQIFRVDGHGAEAKGSDLADLRNLYLRDERAKYMNDLKARSNIEVLIK